MKHNLEVTYDRKQIKLKDFIIVMHKVPDPLEKAMAGLAMVKEGQHDDDIYRVNVDPPTRIEVICFGMDKLDDTVEGVYDNINDLPTWMQERLSVLSMLPPNTSGMNDVKGIGRRITESIYWIYAQK